MLIYIIHDNYISTFRLPKEVSGNYMLSDIDSDGKQRSLINISSNDGKWILNSNNDISVYFNDNFVSNIELTPYNFYNLNYYEKEFLILYVFPGFDTSYTIKFLNPGQSATFGSDPSCDISYDNNFIGKKQFKFEYINNVWKFDVLNDKVPFYINRVKADVKYLDNFDTIFILGIRFNFAGNCIIISFPPTKPVQINSNLIFSENYMYAVKDKSSKEIVKDFYNSRDYFYKSPIFKQKLEKTSITITPPDEKEKNSNGSLLADIVPSALMSVSSLVSLYFTFQNSGKDPSENKEVLITSVIMCAVMLLTGICWPIIEHFASRIKLIVTSRARVVNYKRYLKRKEEEMVNIINKERSVLQFNNISLQECKDAILARTSNLYSKNVENDSFLKIKFGVGRVKSSINIDYSKPDFIVLKDNLYNYIDILIEKYKYIEDATFTFSLKNTSIAIIDIKNNYNDYMKALILQLVGQHDYNNLKLVVLTKEGSDLNLIKNLNHCWNNERTFRYYANNLQEGENISSELIKIANKSKLGEDADKIIPETHYIIVSDCIEKYKGLKIVDYILKTSKEKTNNHFMSLLMFSDKVTNIPTGCEYFINYNNNECIFFNSEMDENNLIKFKPEIIDTTIDFYGCIEKLSNIPIKINSTDIASSTKLPTKLGFLEMYGVGNINQLNILERWKSAAIASTLQAPLGVDSSGNTLYLDLHEKKHGPHGLVAGMTGSGKSELIVTYILSLAINYSPEEVQFVLIDYKGGGLAGAFENRKTGVKLPHLVGTITNLDKAEMNRTLVSIKSELQRRQKVFNSAKERLNTGSIDIYKYQMLVRDGSLTEPMSHLFIICDEFAELKAQQPEFMNELVSAARIGRSLGIHLILATQKPSGVVDDQIWSNAKFKICCRVQTAEDSNEMLRKPDAAYLKESGRFYLQVGYDEYFALAQAGYSGVQYIPSEIITTNLDNSIAFINNYGDIYRNVTMKDEIDKNNQVENLGEELNNILQYIVQIAKENNYQNHQLWLENVPKRLFYADLIQKYSGLKAQAYYINPIVGEYDDPENQSQGIVQIPITGAGNTILEGNSGSGKFTFLSTLIFSTMINHTSQEVNFYILDFGSEKFNIFKKAPHVGDVLTSNDKNKLRYFFYMIETELIKRQKYYAENGGDFALDVQNNKPKFPNIVVIIYGLETFKEDFDELYFGLFSSIIRLSPKVGIEFIITVESEGSIGSAIENSFKQKILLQLTDEQDYQYIFKDARTPSNNPGRGIILQNDRAVEFQTALIYDEMKLREYLDAVFVQLKNIMNYEVKKVPDISKKLSLTEYLSYVTDLSNVPLGVNVLTAQQERYDFTRLITLFSAESDKNIPKFISKFSSIICACQNTNLIILNALEEINIKADENAKYYNSDYEKIVNVLYDNCIKLNKAKSDKKFAILILSYNRINKYLLKKKQEDENIKTLDDLIKDTQNDYFKYMIYESDSNFEKLMNAEISNLFDNSNGIWIGVEYDSQSAFEMQRITEDEGINQSNELIAIIRESEPIITRYPTIE